MEQLPTLGFPRLQLTRTVFDPKPAPSLVFKGILDSRCTFRYLYVSRVSVSLPLFPSLLHCLPTTESKGARDNTSNTSPHTQPSTPAPARTHTYISHIHYHTLTRDTSPSFTSSDALTDAWRLTLPHYPKQPLTYRRSYPHQHR